MRWPRRSARERRQVGRTDGGVLDDLLRGASGSPDPATLRAELRRLGGELDDIVLAAVDAAFSPAFAITGAMALLAALVLLPA